jgi:hypothetical protein
MASKYEPIIEELRQDRQNLMALWGPVGTRQVRVTRHPPGKAAVDITDQYEAGFRKATDALNKAITILEQLKA